MHKNESLLKLTEPHIEAYNTFIDLIPEILNNIPQYTFTYKTIKYSFKLISIDIDKPYNIDRFATLDKHILPKECRLRRSTYKGRVTGTFEYSINGKKNTIQKNIGYIPVMLRSKLCHLKNNSPSENVKCGEDENEIGGYFVINGNDKAVRLLISQKRNFIFGLMRDSNSKKGNDFSEFCVSMRCIGPDEIGQVLFLHYLNDGNVILRLYIRKREFLLPVSLILNALIETTDEEIFNCILNENNDSIYAKRVSNMINSFKEFKLQGKMQCLDYIGKKFKIIINEDEYSDLEVGKEVINRFIAVHLKDYRDKFNFLMMAIKKLYRLVDNKRPDNPDSQMNHEILTVTQIFSCVLKDRIIDCFKGLGKAMTKMKKKDEENFCEFFKKYNFDISNKFDTLMSTGNLLLNSSSDITESAGLTILAEKLNFFRFISHFRSVNRGNFFAQLKTTTVRKLKPESWGFFCPVHTPDGTPCGIITHMARKTEIITINIKFDIDFLFDLGMIPNVPGFKMKSNCIEVVVDGRIVGFIDENTSISFVAKIRKIRCLKNLKIEVVLFAKDYDLQSMYPGVFIFTNVGRLTRPVFNNENKVEYIGIMEQVFLYIKKASDDDIIKDYDNKAKNYDDEKNIYKKINSEVYKIEENNSNNRKINLEENYNDEENNSNNKKINSEEYNKNKEPNFYKKINSEELNKIEENNFNKEYSNVTNKQTNLLFNSYREIDKTSFLSVVACLTPFSDFNQSPRNMYQCQMAKQTMGTAFHNHKVRSDNKAYKIIYPQSPLVKTNVYEEFKFDDYPMGINAIVAVLSYTGYDMEDAMVINKSSMERGFFYGSVYKTEIVELENKDDKVIELPEIGKWLGNSDLFYRIKKNNGEIKNILYKGFDKGIVESVRIFNKNEYNLFTFSVVLRIPRNPSIGDKFCSRHGQKGVCSMHWPAIDMPFTENGIVPDIIINPHAFPSRMTIGMLIESMAGKSGCLLGKSQNGTAFQFNSIEKNEENNFDKKTVENISAIDYFGRELENNGYNYYGNEIMHSGITGDQFKAEIFIGVVYYQRLRHMVNDKFQVRTTGAVQTLTRQPVGGRKNKGGVRLGEMERDALISHGVSYILQDRLQYGSDYTEFLYCVSCKSVLFCAKNKCICGGNEYKTLGMPYAFKYLCTELLSMNVRVILELNE